MLPGSVGRTPPGGPGRVRRPLPGCTFASQVQAGLVAAGYSREELGGPAGNWALVIDSVGMDPECRIQATARPPGGTMMLAVLDGAACPLG